MILKLLVDLSVANQPTADYFNRYNRYFGSGEINREVKDAAVVFAALAAEYADGKITRLDGLSVEYPDFWFNVRSSNTEPKIRLNLEATSREIMEKKRNEILELIK
jgi:phosphomannomutase